MLFDVAAGHLAIRRPIRHVTLGVGRCRRCIRCLGAVVIGVMSPSRPRLPFCGLGLRWVSAVR